MESKTAACGAFELPKLRIQSNSRRSRSKKQAFDIYDESAPVASLPFLQHDANAASRQEELHHSSIQITSSFSGLEISIANKANIRKRRSPPFQQAESRIEPVPRSKSFFGIKAPLAKSVRPVQIQCYTPDRAGSSDGKENFPPGYLPAWKEDLSCNVPHLNGEVHYNVRVKDQGNYRTPVAVNQLLFTPAPFKYIEDIATFNPCTTHGDSPSSEMFQALKSMERKVQKSNCKCSGSS